MFSKTPHVEWFDEKMTLNSTLSKIYTITPRNEQFLSKLFACYIKLYFL